MATKPKAKKSPFKIEKKRSGRYMVTDARTGASINAEKKVEILLQEGLIKAPLKKKEAAT
jgi:hypothetical protein